MNTSNPGNRICLDDGWAVASSAETAERGPRLSTLIADTAGWHRTRLPCTVLAALHERGDIPDPYVGTNLRDAIPGQGPRAQNFSNHPMPEDSPFAVPWWFRKEFRVPPEAGPHLRLCFDGINYRANLWLNGRRLDGTLVGAYRTFELDVTGLVDRGGVNVLAVEITAPGPCDLAITWVDWNPSPPDKNMGIWRDVWLAWSGPVALRAPFVASKLDGVERARLTIAGDLVNHSDQPQLATVHAELDGRRFSQRFELAPREERAFELTPAKHAGLVVEQPRLWWPRNLGKPEMYGLALEVTTGAASAVSDATAFDFGIREVASRLTAERHTVYEINGQPLIVRGAGWATDLMLRRQPERDLAQLEYVKALNLDAIRFEGALERAEFLEWCDREGILVIAGWCCCDCWEKWPQWNEENHVVGAESLRSQIRRVRRHPSLIAWWYGSDFPPPPRVEAAYLRVLEEERWPNAHQSSAANKPTELTGPSGLKMEGPYEYVPPGYWFEDTARGGAFGFATEISPGAAIPPVESLRRMLPAEHLWPIDEVWSFHCGGQEFHTAQRFVDALTARYGEAADVETLARLAQLVTYEGQRAMFEAYTRNKYHATGVIQWMLNNAWPSLIWHLHDYFLRPGGGFFGTQKACTPLHVMYAPDDHSVVITNQGRADLRDLAVVVRMLDASRPAGELVQRVVRGLEVGPDGKRVALTLPAPSAPLTFVDLRLETAAGERLDHNTYWLPAEPDVLDYASASWLHCPTARHADLRGVRALPPATVAAEVTADGDGLSVTLDNRGDAFAFFVQLRLADAGGADVLPVIWTDNYVSLFPGDRRTVRVHVPGGALPPGAQVEVSGINLASGYARAVTDRVRG